ncbi:MAG: hypothetical protein J7M11_02600, partial [Elusimicrobia bacterium]|nr:hypothetical protein [Elusimicrobiota bacterium]
ETLREPPVAKRIVKSKKSRNDVVIKMPQRELIDSINSQNIFGAKMEPTVSEPLSDDEIEDALGEGKDGEEEVNNDCPATAIRAQLVGVIYAPGFEEYQTATITDLGAQDPQLYHTGDKLMGEAEIKSIEIDRVVIENQGKRECLFLGGGDGTKKAEGEIIVEYVDGEKKPQTHSLRGRIEKSGENEWRVSRGVLQKYIEKLDKHSNIIRVAPNFEAGKPEGFRLTYIKPEGVFEQLGFIEGDIIVKAGEIDIKSEKDAFAALNELRGSNEIAIEIKRQGESTVNLYVLQ